MKVYKVEGAFSYQLKVYVDFWEIEPSDSDFFGTDSDEEFPRGDDLDFLDDDLEANEDNPQDKRIAELSREDIMQLQFTDEEVVFRFYKTYAMMHRFAVRSWRDIVARYNLSSNSWVVQTYELRNLWALAYLRDQFFGRIKTTSQCEWINSLIKAYVRKKDTLLEFINNMETVVSYRNNERVAEFNSKYTDPVLMTSLLTLEDFAAKTFTRNMFREVKKEIEGACAMNTELNSSDFVKAMNDVVNTITKLQKRGENSCNGNLDNDYIVDLLVVKSKGAPKKNSKFKQQRRCSNCGMTRHYNKNCPNVPGRIPKEPIDDDTEKNISSHPDILTKHKRHDSVKNQQKMEKDRSIGGGTAPTSTAKLAFTNQVKISSPGSDIPVCASTSNKESGMSSRPGESPVVGLETGMADEDYSDFGMIELELNFSSFDVFACTEVITYIPIKI
ncbi:hypothetical protein Ahy_A05g025405 [Arachis hypogaea]|uniref:Protein FAR1-RELATED SEQUENCE n=1 Tax=Arachis hypogaea TaxID=3818 RepID=A0A445D8M1_ARAHY|nr:hypothetical protein Ahy_A05g025405 [Arachis hypogaea]